MDIDNMLCILRENCEEDDKYTRHEHSDVVKKM